MKNIYSENSLRSSQQGYPTTCLKKMPRASFDIDEAESTSDDGHVSNEFDSKFGITDMLGQHLSYKVVGRLSRWEGGQTSPYAEEPKVQPAVSCPFVEDELQLNKNSIFEYLRQFFDRELDNECVTFEDIERVKFMHDRFLHNAQFCFNYTTLLVIASVIAGVGLGSNSSGTVIASMLVSPLMGPVTAIAYGMSIGDWKMVRIAFSTELLSLMVCIVIGIQIAVCMEPFFADEWPSEEMKSRGTWKTFFAGIPIAFFSGLGVAVGLLDSQTNSLVGVAISASLLPPAVNMGMLFTFILYDPEKNHIWWVPAKMSLFLTLMNIGVIIVASMIMFRLKETLPIEKSIFWTDLGVARKIYNNVAFAPDDKEIHRRVATFFPRASQMAARSPSFRDGVKNLSVNLSSPTESYDKNYSPKSDPVTEG